jgi:predicted transcriptional regulator of viral defense system
VAARQWGVLDIRQLRACGLTDTAVRLRVRAGRLHPLYRGVYALGHPAVPVEGRLLAAVKACGPGAVLSHFSAAVLYGWFEWDGRHPQVTAPKPRRHAGIVTYRSQELEATAIQGIPVTAPARTLLDLAATLHFTGVRRAVNEAFNQRRIVPAELVVSDRRGSRVLREILAGAAPTRNEYEDTVLAILDGLPPPDVTGRW